MLKYTIFLICLLLIVCSCPVCYSRENLSRLDQSIVSNDDTDPFSKEHNGPGSVKTEVLKAVTPGNGRFYKLSIKPGGRGYPGANVNFAQPVDFSKHDVLKVWVRVNLPVSYLEIVINGADGVIQDMGLVNPASRGYGKLQAGKWYAAYLPYKASPGWVRFGEKMNHSAIKSITVYTFADYLKTYLPIYEYSFGGMELLTSSEAQAEVNSGAGRKTPVTAMRICKTGNTLIWSSDPLEKVYRSTPIPEKQKQGHSLYAEGAGGEYVPVVCNINSKSDLAITSVTCKPLKGSIGKISADSCDVRYVDYVRDAFEEHPDPLPLAFGKRIQVKANANSSLWITWHIPVNTKPGIYKGSLSISFSNGKTISVPTALKIYGFNLPNKTHLKSLYWIHHFYGGVPYFVERAKRYWGCELPAFSSEYRECVNNIISDYGEHRITPELDRQEFSYLSMQDRGKLIEKYNFDPGFNIYHNIINEFLAANPLTQQRIDQIGTAMRKRADELEALGYKDITCIKIVDEPNEDTVKIAALAAETMQKYIPEIQRFYAGASYKIPDALVGKLNTYCMSWGMFDFTGSQAKERLAAGDKLWTYYADYKANTAYDPLELRLNYWLYWKFNITGVHYAHDSHSFFLTYPNDTYPHSDGLKEIPSIRFEMLRLGLQDYEYLWTLKYLIEKTGNRDRAILDLVNIPDTLAKNEWECTSDPLKLQQRRKKIAAAIIKLTKTAQQSN